MADAQPPPENPSNIESSPPAAQADRSWERAWTLKEMRDGANNWSLASDAGMLLYLQEFSQKLISRTHEIEKEVENLVHDSKLTSVRVNNVFNDFMMLANTQFVENRVYDDNPEVEQTETPVDEKKTDSQEKSREQKEAALIPKVSEAIRLGVEVIEKAFEKLDTNIDNSDSEEDESYRVDPILEAKDPYLERSLPYLIGTPNFMNDDNVGLHDISDEDSDAGEISESEESADEDNAQTKGSDSEYSYSDSDSDEGNKKKPPAKEKEKPMFGQESSDEDSDSEGSLFGTSGKKEKADDSSSEEETGSESEEETPKSQPAPPGAPMDFASELARKLGGAPPKAPSPTATKDSDEDEWEEKPTKKESKKKKKSKEKKTEEKRRKSSARQEDEDLFGGKGDDSDGSDLFSGGTFGRQKDKSMFDDSDEGDLFGEASTPKERKNTQSKAEEDDDDVPAKKSERSRTRTSSSGKKLPAGAVPMFGAPEVKPAQNGGLFDDEEEDDIFSSVQSKPKKDTKAADKPPAASATGGAGLFDDEDDDDMFNTSQKAPSVEKEETPVKKTQPEKRHPAGGVPMFGAPGMGNALAKALKNKGKRQDSDEEEQDDDWSDGERSHSSSIKSNQSAASKQSGKMPSVQSKDSLFAEDPDDSMATTKPKSNSFSRNAKTTKGLFDEDEEDDLFASTTSSAPATTKSTPSTAAATTSSNKSKGSGDGKSGKASSLFMSDEEDDLFGIAPAKPKQPEKKKPAGAVSIFPTGMADPFKKTEPEPKKEDSPKKETTGRPAAKSISMFDDDGNADGEDLFGSSGSKPKPPTQPVAPSLTQQTPKQPAQKKKSIFDDDDGDLFGATESADIFAKPSSQKQSTDVKKSSIAKESKADPGLFGDKDGEEDLFGAPTSTRSKPATNVEVAGVTTSESSDVDPLKSADTTDAAPKTKKPPVGGVSMFGPGGLPKLSSNKSSSVTTVKKPEARKATTVDPLFGDDGDDLFAAPVKKTEVKKKEPVKKVEVKEERSSSKGPLDDDAEDLFSTPSAAAAEPKPQTPESPKEVKSRKPVGGVSMFGGMDPFGALKKPGTRSKSPEPVPSTDEGSKKETAEDDDMFASKQEKPPASIATRKPSIEESKQGTSLSGPPRGKIGKLQATLNFNPAAMLPGAAPPSKEPEPLDIGFDIPAEARTLQSANKDRAKIGAKRRPPSRHARKAAASATTPTSPTDAFFADSVSPPSTSPVRNDLDLNIDVSRVPPPLSESPVRSPSPEFVTGTDSTKQKTDLFGNEDLFGSDLPKTGAKSSIGQRSDTNLQKNSPIEDDDIFSKKTIDFPKSKQKEGDLDDLFTSTKTDTSKPKTAAITLDNDDDIFSSATVKSSSEKKKPIVTDSIDSSKSVTMNSSSSEKKSTKTTAAAPTSGPLDDDDDIFAVKKSKPKPKPSPIIEDDDDDIFASSTLNKSKDTKQANGIPDDDLFGDAGTSKTKEKPSSAAVENDDDIFATAKPDKKKTKKAVTRDDDLFADSTDIFSDIPKSKPKEKKTKKKTTAGPKKTIFKDDIDDIFADTSASGKPKEKKDKKKSSKDKTGDKTTPAVDDPLMS